MSSCNAKYAARQEAQTENEGHRGYRNLNKVTAIANQLRGQLQVARQSHEDGLRAQASTQSLFAEVQLRESLSRMAQERDDAMLAATAS